MLPMQWADNNRVACTKRGSYKYGNLEGAQRNAMAPGAGREARVSTVLICRDAA